MPKILTRFLRRAAPLAALMALAIAGGCDAREGDSKTGKGSSAAQEEGSKADNSFRDCSGCPEMVVVSPGSFTMGSPESEEGRYIDEGPQRLVTIGYRFAVGKYEVTWNQYNACVSDKGCTERPSYGAGGSIAVFNVSWNDAKAYAAWLSRKTGKSYRLLSEAEWEYAARAGTTTVYNFGDTFDPKQAGHFHNGRQGEDLVPGRYPANAFGLHDMVGNVEEWTEDCYEDSYSAGQPSDGSAYTDGSCSYRVIRGGGWSAPQNLLRSAARDWSGPDHGLPGIRIAQTLP